MGTAYTTAYSSQDPSSTGIQKRTVYDRIRWLFPGASTLFAFVSYGDFKGGNLVKKQGMLGKKMTSKQRRYEFFTYTPLVNLGTVSSTDGTNHTMDTVEGFLLKRTVVNDRTLEVGRITSVNTSTKVITVTAVSSTFVPAAADKLFIMAPAYGEGSTSPYSVRKTEDNNYNVMQICRYPWLITKSAQKSDNYAIPNMLDELGRRTMIEGNILTERNFIFGERASTSTTDVTADATLGDSFGTMHGFWNFAQNSFDAGNSMSYDNFFTDLPLAMGRYVNPAEKVIMLCGQKVFGETQGWIMDKFQQVKDGDLAKYGVRSFKFQTAGPVIELVQHDLFNLGQFQNRALLLCPDVLQYVHRTDRDLMTNKNIQANDADYIEHEILGELTCADLAGGYCSTKITNWFAL